MGGQDVTPRTPREAIGKGIVYVTESRKTDGLFLSMSLQDNSMAPVLEQVSGRLGFLNRGRMDQRVKAAIGLFDISTTGARQVVNTLSGGNQQKVINHSDRILTLHDGRTTGDFSVDQVDENMLLQRISGVTEEDQ